MITEQTEQIIKKLEIIMLNENLRRYELARKLNTTEANISRWLSRKYNISKAWRLLIKEIIK